jgi:hypothetical protein
MDLVDFLGTLECLVLHLSRRELLQYIMLEETARRT